MSLILVFNKNSPRAHTESELNVPGVHGMLVKYVVHSSKRKNWENFIFLHTSCPNSFWSQGILGVNVATHYHYPIFFYCIRASNCIYIYSQCQLPNEAFCAVDIHSGGCGPHQGHFFILCFEILQLIFWYPILFVWALLDILYVTWTPWAICIPDIHTKAMLGIIGGYHQVTQCRWDF
jgi:hypothetical protein